MGKITDLTMIASTKSLQNTNRLHVTRASRLISSFATNSIQNTFCKFAVGLLMIPSPANALVDDRLAGEGTGKALGINDPILGWVMICAFTVVWVAFYAATKELGCQGEEDGLSL